LLLGGLMLSCSTNVGPSASSLAISNEPSMEAPSLPAAASPSELPSLPAPPRGPVKKAKVVEVIDGDTIRVDLAGRTVTVRYIGMDAPELQHPDTPVQWMGPEARDANVTLLADGGNVVYLEKDVSETDRFGRLLRYVWILSPRGWRLVDQELVRLGFARVATFPPDVKDIDPWFFDAEQQARDAGIGLWARSPAPSGSAAEASVLVCGGQKNAPGDDNSNLNGEFVVVCNRGSASVSLSGWTLTDDGPNHTFRFPTFTLGAGATVTIYSGAGTNSSTALYWHSDGGVWNNDGDCAHLITPSGAVASSRCM
jgi:micrococcal nuclease